VSRALLRDALDGGPIDALLFTSGSTVRGLAALASDIGVDLRNVPTVCIGDPTASVAVGAGFEVVAVSPAADATTLARTTRDALVDRRPPIPQLQETR
jgi:uroporphyrinogen-III synthase